MGDIIIPKKTFGSFMLGLSVAFIVLFIIGGVFAATVFNAGGGTIANVATPVANTDAATKAYADAAGKPSFEGFTDANVNGNLDGVNGMNDRCDGNYSGSHACTYDEIIRLGASYTYASDAWVVDGSYIVADVANSNYAIISIDGSWEDTNNGAANANCNGWTSSSSSGYAGVMDDGATNNVRLATCSSTLRIPCCS